MYSVEECFVTAIGTTTTHLITQCEIVIQAPLYPDGFFVGADLLWQKSVLHPDHQPPLFNLTGVTLITETDGARLSDVEKQLIMQRIGIFLSRHADRLSMIEWQGNPVQLQAPANWQPFFFTMVQWPSTVQSLETDTDYDPVWTKSGQSSFSITKEVQP